MFVSFDGSSARCPLRPSPFLALTIAHFLRFVKTNPPTPISSYFASLRGSKLPLCFAHMRTPIPLRGGRLSYIRQKRIFAVQISGKYILPKTALVDFLTDDFAFEIVHKSTWHMNTILLFIEKE